MRTALLSVCLLVAPAFRASATDAYVEPVSPTFQRDFHSQAPAQHKLWKMSLVAVAAANALDAHSSWGKRELNPTLATAAGTFGGRSLGLKLIFTGGLVGVEYLLARRRPGRTFYKVTSIVNFGSASVTTATAIRNYGIARPQR
jgi:hypothetical protein